jgi:hypothetical protein
MAEGEELGSNLLQVDHRIKAGSRVLPRSQHIGALSRWRECPQRLPHDKLSRSRNEELPKAAVRRTMRKQVMFAILKQLAIQETDIRSHQN